MQCEVFRAKHAVQNMQCQICIAKYTLPNMHCQTCSAKYALPNMQCQICSAKYAVLNMHCQICSAKYAVPNMHCQICIAKHAVPNTQSHHNGLVRVFVWIPTACMVNSEQALVQTLHRPWGSPLWHWMSACPYTLSISPLIFVCKPLCMMSHTWLHIPDSVTNGISTAADLAQCLADASV